MECIRENNLVVNSAHNTNDYCQAMFTTYPDLVDIKQLTKMLGIGVTLAYRLVQNNTIKAFCFFIFVPSKSEINKRVIAVIHQCGNAKPENCHTCCNSRNRNHTVLRKFFRQLLL